MVKKNHEWEAVKAGSHIQTQEFRQVEHRLKRGRKEIELKLTTDRKANNGPYLQGVKNRILPRSESWKKMIKL